MIPKVLKKELFLYKTEFCHKNDLGFIAHIYVLYLRIKHVKYTHNKYHIISTIGKTEW